LRKFPSEIGVAPRARMDYYAPVDSQALLEGAETELGRPWSRTDPLPPARLDNPQSPGPRKVSYTHEDCVDFIIQNPAITQKALAERYGYSQAWMSLIINCDAFQALLAKRRDEILSPEIRASIEERFKALVQRSQDLLLDALHGPKATPALALGVLGTASKALGYGARDLTVKVDASFVVELPRAAQSSEEWSGRIIEGQKSNAVVSKTA
jgi:hypothetical protein